MTIECYQNASEKNKMNKELTLVASISGAVKNETSLIDPIIMVDSTMEVIRTVNYLYIPEFGRYYFINSIKSVRTGIVEIECHVDVLASFKDAILSNRAIIKRQENAPYYNLYLDDGSFKVYSESNFKTKSFPSGFGSLHYVLMVCG